MQENFLLNIIDFTTEKVEGLIVINPKFVLRGDKKEFMLINNAAI